MTEQEKQPRYFYVGQTVHCANYGKGEVISTTNTPLNEYPVLATFENATAAYTFDGRRNKSEKPTLSQTPIPEIQNVPLPEMPDLEPGDVVVCWDNNKESAIIALFRSFSPGDKHSYAVCFTPTDTGDRCQFYKNCEKYDPEKHYRK